MRSSQVTRTAACTQITQLPTPKEPRRSLFSLSVARVVSHRSSVFIPMSVIQETDPKCKNEKAIEREREACRPQQQPCEQVQRLSVFLFFFDAELCCLIFLRISFIARLKKYKMQFSDIFFCSDLTDPLRLEGYKSSGRNSCSISGMYDELELPRGTRCNAIITSNRYFFEFPLELYQPTMDGDCEKRKRLEMTQEISFPSPR